MKLPINDSFRFSVVQEGESYYVKDNVVGRCCDSPYETYQTAIATALLENIYTQPEVNIYFDMDGVLAEYDKNFNEAEARKKGYFLNRPAQVRAIDLMNKLAENYEVNIFICSAVYKNDYASAEKNEWLDRHGVSSAVKRIFVPYGSAKSDYMSDKGINILIDDYSKNLHEWVEAGGYGIKFMNGLNGTKGTWKGPCIDMKMSVMTMYDVISDYIAQARSFGEDRRGTRTKDIALAHLQNILNREFNFYQLASEGQAEIDTEAILARYNICKSIAENGAKLDIIDINNLITEPAPLDRIYVTLVEAGGDINKDAWRAVQDTCADINIPAHIEQRRRR